MNTQLDLLQSILQPGVYSCSLPWVNEMGHKWQPGDEIHLLRHASAAHVVCSFPRDERFGLVFHLNASRVAHSFTFTRPLAS